MVLDEKKEKKQNKNVFRSPKLKLFCYWNNINSMLQFIAIPCLSLDKIKLPLADKTQMVCSQIDSYTNTERSNTLTHIRTHFIDRHLMENFHLVNAHRPEYTEKWKIEERVKWTRSTIADTNSTNECSQSVR